MNDEQLIVLVEENNADDLSVDQLTAIHARMGESAPLRDSLKQRVQIEQQLSGKLGASNVPVEAILTQVSLLATSALATTTAFSIWSWKVGLSLVVAASVTVYSVVTFLPDEKQPDKPEQPKKVQPEAEKPAPKEKPKPVIPPEPIEEPSPSDIGPEEDLPEDDKNGEQEKTDKGTDKSKDETNQPKGSSGDSGPSGTLLVAQNAEKNVTDKKETQAKDSTTKKYNPKEPWTHSLHYGSPAESFQKLAFDEQYSIKHSLQQTDLDLWFSRIRNHEIRKLKAPWKENTVIRISLKNYSKFRMHFFHQQQGVTVNFHQNHINLIAAYRSRWDPKSGEISPLSLAATDQGRAFALGLKKSYDKKASPKTMDIWHQQGTLVFSRGNIVLLAVPMETKPDSFIFSGGTIHSFQVKLAKDFPQVKPTEKHENILSKLEKSRWKISELSKGHLTKFDDGRIQLSRSSKDERVTAALKIPTDAPAEMVLQLENPAGGTGIYLAQANSVPSWVGMISTNRKKNTMSFNSTYFGDQKHKANKKNWQSAPASIIGNNSWIKIIVGSGQVRCYIGADGINWGRAFNSSTFNHDGYTYLGLFCEKINLPNQITIKRLEYRPLKGLAALVSKELLSKAVFEKNNTTGQWLSTIMKQKPQDIETACVASCLCVASDLWWCAPKAWQPVVYQHGSTSFYSKAVAFSTNCGAR